VDHLVVYGFQYLLLCLLFCSEVRYVTLVVANGPVSSARTSHRLLSVCLVIDTLLAVFVAAYRLVDDSEAVWRDGLEASSLVAVLFLQIYTCRLNGDHVYLFTFWTLRLLALLMSVAFDGTDAYRLAHAGLAVAWLCLCGAKSLRPGDVPPREPNLIRRLLFSWLDQTYREAHRESASFYEGKMFDRLDEDHRCKTLLELYGTATDRQGDYTAVDDGSGRKKHEGHRFTIYKLLVPFQRDIILSGLNRFALISFYFLCPYLLRVLLEENQSRLAQKWIVTALFDVSVIIALLNTQYQHATNDIGLRIQSILMGALYRSILAEAPTGKTSSATLTTYTGVFVPFVQDLHMMWSGPLIIVVTFFALWVWVIGPSGIVGLTIMVMVIAIMRWLANKVQQRERCIIRCKNARVRLTTDSIEQMQQIKSDSLEELFEERIGEHRQEELRHMTTCAWYDALHHLLGVVTPMIVACGTFLFMYLIGSGSLLTVQSMFVAIALFNITRYPMSILPKLMTSWTRAQESLNHINQVVCAGRPDEEPIVRTKDGIARKRSHKGSLEKLQEVVHTFVNQLEDTISNQREAILKIENGQFSIGKEVILRDINITLRRGTFTAVGGTHGSGKTTLLRALIGTVKNTAGTIACTWNRLSYCPQTPWLHSGTIRSNILFGQEYDPMRYEEVIRACCLEEDFRTFADFDERIVAEGGHSLSGGQARRISLARAVYRRADVYLFDDPLRSLDPTLSRKVLENVFHRTNGLLAGCSCMFVTHDRDHLAVADTVLVMSGGTVDRVLTPAELSEQLVQEIDDDHRAENDPDASPVVRERDRKKRSKQTNDKSGDRIRSGRASLDLYASFARMLKLPCCTVVVSLEGVTTALDIIITTLLAHWASNHGRTDDIFVVIVPLVLIWSGCVFLKTAILQGGGLRLAKSIHARMVATILHQPMAFFDRNDSGVIVNRFSNDLNVLDAKIITNLRTVLTASFGVLGTLTLFVSKLYTELALVTMASTGAILLVYGLKRLLGYHLEVAKALKRFEATSRSPIILQYNETVQGIDTIKAHDAEDRFFRLFVDKIDCHQNYIYHNNSASRWIGIRLECIGAIVIYCVSLLTVSNQSLVGLAFVGIIVSYVLRLIPSLNSLFLMAGLLEENIIAFERVAQYLDLPRETNDSAGVDYPSAGKFPARGPIEYRDVSLTHADGSTVLHNITLTIAAGEKLGIVGRTGSGKSSFIGMLFRFYPEHLSGSVRIADVELARISLKQLRFALTLVPQSTSLYSGLVQNFIDPRKIHTVDHLNNTLRECGLGNISLGATLQELSVGQCQLLCLVRGLLRERPIIVLDEATSALDEATEAHVLKLLQDQFHDRTVLMIAHHLDTVRTCDRILWLQDGRVRKIAPLEEYTLEERNELGFRKYGLQMTFEEFCGGPFWDDDLTWREENPDLTFCFQRIILQWTPCFFLFIFSIYEVFRMLTSRYRDIPWNWFNLTKMGFTFALMVMSWVDLGVVVQNLDEPDVFDVQILVAIFNALAYIMVLALYFFYRKYGVRSSGTMFIFWFLKAFFGIIQMRTEAQLHEIRGSGTGDFAEFQFISYTIQYTFLCVVLLLELFPDKEPRYSEWEKLKNPNPELRSSFFSRLFYLYFDSYAWRGFRKPLTDDDMYDLNPEDTSRALVPPFDKYWFESVEKGRRKQIAADKKAGKAGLVYKPNAATNGSVLPAMVKAYGGPFWFAGMLQFAISGLQFASPYLMQEMMAVIALDGPFWKGMIITLGLFLTSLLIALFNGQYFHRTFLVGFRIRTGLISAIYRKALRISSFAKKDTTVGEIVNLMAVDAQRFFELTSYLHVLWSAPLIIALCIYLLYELLGPAVFAGLGVMVIMIPITGFIATRMRDLQVEQMEIKDERVKKMNEILGGIKVLKLYAWEPSFQDTVVTVRNEELDVLKRAAYYGAGTYFVWTMAPFLVTLASFAVFVMVDEENVLDPQTAFVALALFNILRFPLAMFPMMITFAMQAWVSIKRIDKFMNSEELDPNNVTRNKSENAVEVKDGTFSWGDDAPTLKNMNVALRRGKLSAVVGGVGTGKSSLISALLGEMEKMKGSVNTDGSIAYVPQQAWIQNATLRDNILFGLPFNQAKYDKVIECCALKPDLEMLPGGDTTEIGEKGINLSGGQKQRVALARAVYADSEIYLFDDPLSAVDAHVGKHIFEKVIGPTGMLVGKSRLLVTHGISFLPFVEEIFVMKDGEISESGSYQQLLDQKGAFADFLTQHIQEMDDEDEDELKLIQEALKDGEGKKIVQRAMSTRSQRSGSSNGSVRKKRVSRAESRNSNKPRAAEPAPQQASAATLIEKEESATGAVGYMVYVKYFKGIGLWLGFWSIFFSVINQGASIYANIWLTDWSEDPEAATDNSVRDMYLGVYGGLGGAQSIALLIASITLALGCVRAARELHNNLLESSMHMPMSFFDTTPLGRIMNRFSKDVDVVDNILPQSIRAWLLMFFNVVGVFVVIGISTPIFLAVVPAFLVVYYLIQKFYIATSRQLKRLESVTRSPIYSHFGESITGQSTIRAYGQQDRFMNESEQRVDYNQLTSYPSIIANRWLAVRLELVGALVVFFAALFAMVARDDIGQATVGLSISYALQISATLSFLVRMTAEVETNIVAIERLEEYTVLPREADWQKGTVDKAWPAEGKIDLIVLLFFMRKYGIRTSGTMFVFWFLRMFFGIIQLRTEVMENDKRPNPIGSGDSLDFWEYQYVSYIIQYAFICLMLVLELFPDKAPKFSEYPKATKPNPELSSSFFGRLLFLHFDSFAWKGFRNPLTVDDMYDINPEDASRALVPPFDKYWKVSVEKGRKQQMAANRKAGKPDIEYKPHAPSNGSVLYTMVRAYGGPFWFAGMLHLAISGLQFASPYLMQELMAVIALDGPLWKGLLLTFGLFGASLLLGLINGQYLFNTFLSGFRIRTGLISAIYRKALRISSAAKKDTTVGEIVNLMAVDAQKFFELTSYLHVLWAALLIIGLCVFLLYDILGPAVFAGLGVMVLMTPITGVVAAKLKGHQVSQMKLKDERVKKMSEILGGIKVLKLYAWEPSFQDTILTVRSEEISILRRMAYYGAGTYFTFTIAPFLVTLVSFTVFVLVDENNVLDPQTAFVSLALFNIMRFPLGMFPMVVTFAMQAWVSVKRIDKFLNSAELDPNNVSHEKSDEALTIKDGTFSWGEETPTLKNINLSLAKGQLSAIVGTVGTGKSSLISALLGEMEKISGHVNTDGTLAYVPQQAWIQNATLRDNILFGKPFDQKKYDNVIECCALKPDLEMLPGGDTTEIGEKGINLSGGQKQRVALARAVYADAEVYLFDDPLSAVDAHVGKHIFEKVIGPSGMLVGKTRLLVTHGISYLPFVEEILVLKDGEISESGTYQQLLDQKGAFAEFLNHHIQELDDEDEEISLIEESLKNDPASHIIQRALSIRSIRSNDSDRSTRKKRISRQESKQSVQSKAKDTVPVRGKLIGVEESATGAVTWLVYKKYIQAIGFQFGFWSVLFSAINQGSGIYSNIWLTDWSEDKEAATDTSVRDMYLGVYGALGGVQSIALFLGSVLISLGCLKAAKESHDKLLHSSLRMPMSFFDTTPLGRIINRFSKDVDVVDNVLPVTIRAWLFFLFSVVGVFIVIGVSTPIFLAVVPPLMVIYYFVQRFYIDTSRQLKRLESVTRSPIYSHFGESISGQSTIRAYGQQERFTQESERRVDYNQLVSYPSIIANRWLGVRLELVGSCVILFAALFAVLARDTIGQATFCGGPFWDDKFVWDVDNPNLTFCFQRVILQWVPCVFLFVFSIYDIFKITGSRYRDIPWNWYNLSKMLVIFLLMCMSWIDLGMVVNFQDEQGLFDVQIVTAVFNALVYIDLIVLLFFMRKYGIRTSGTMFMFWFLRMFFGIIQLRTEVMENDKRPNPIGSGDSLDFWEYQYVSYIIQYAFICLMLVLELFPDKAPKFSEYPKATKPNPELSSSFFGRLLFLHFDSFAWKGFRNPLTVDDMYDINPEDASRALVPPFDKYWKVSVEKGRKQQMAANRKAGKPDIEYKPHAPSNGSVLYTMVRAYGGPFWFAGMLHLAISGLQFASPYLMQELMAVIALDGPLWKGLLLTFGLFGASLLLGLINGQYLFNTFLSGFRIRTGLISAIYRKALRISSAAKKDTTVGEIVNLMAVDAQKFFELTSYLHVLWAALLIIGLCVFLLYDILGPAVFAGLGVMVLMTPITGVVAAKLKGHQVSQMKLKDERVKKMSEILGGIKVLKLYAWEPSFQDTILTVRSEEISILRRMAYYGAGTYFTFTIAPFLVTLVSFTVFVLVDENNVLDPQTAFVSLALFNIMRFPLGMFPMVVTFAMQAWVSVKRIDKFLNSAELDPNNVSHEKSDEALTIKDGTFSWGEETPTLKNINLSSAMTFEKFCGGPFWDDEFVWDVDNPNLTFCFQRVILQWVPCVFLFVFSIYDIFKITESRYRDIPWNWYNLSKMLVIFLLMCMSWIDLGMVVNFQDEQGLFDVQILTAVFNALAYIDLIVLLFFMRKYGVRTSGTMFMFWFLRMFFGIIQLRTEVMENDKRPNPIGSGDTVDFWEYQYVSYIIQYAFICLMLVLELFPDKAPKYSDYPESKNPNPELKSSFFAKLLFLYFDSFAWKGFRKPLTMEEMYDMNPQDASRELVPPFDKYWKKSVVSGRQKQIAADKKAGKPNIEYKPHSETQGSSLYAMVRAYGAPFWFAGMLQLAISGLQFASPYLMQEMMAVIALDGPVWKGLLLTFALFAASLLLALLNGQYYYNTFLSGFRIRTGLVSAIYRKALRISSAAKKDTTVGEIVNLMAVDAQRFFELTSYMHILWSGILIIALCVYLLYDILGAAVFAGLGVMILITPVSGVIATKMRDAQVAQMKIKDDRVKKMNEILGGIKVLKLYAWEPSFQDNILTVRTEEIGILKRMAYYGAGIYFTFTIAPFLVTLVSFAVYVLVDEDNILDPQTAFVSLALFNILRFPLGMLPMMVTFSMQAWVSVKRIDKFLNSAELDPSNPFDQKKYDNVIECCALKPDLEMLPGGDTTEIGEKGINLSGGQKQRVALARAVYADAEVYLFDDPLSAVDAHVGKHIFEKVIGPSGMLVGKSRLLVTHGISYLPFVENIFVVKDGEISESGSYQQLLDQKGAFAEFLTQHIQELDDSDEEEIKLIQESLKDETAQRIVERTLSVRSNRSNGSNGSQRKKRISRQESRVSSKKEEPIIQNLDKATLIEKEESATGAVTWAVYKKYVTAIGFQFGFWSVVFSAINQGSGIYSSMWLTDWSEDPEAITDASVRDMYLGVYGALGGVQSIALFIGSVLLALGCLKAAEESHNKLLESSLHMPMSFFDTTPLGRIINRFSKDVDVVDNILPATIRAWLLMLFSVIGVFVVIGISTPIFLAIVPPLMVIYYFVQRFYIETSRQLKRLESVTRSPIYSHFGESIGGQSTIRAYGQQERFIKESEHRVDYNQLVTYPTILANRWLGVRLEMIGSLVILFAALFAILARDTIGQATVGLSISYALQISNVLSFLVRMTAEVETNIVAIERLEEYTVLPREADWQKGTVDKAWPAEGKVEFKDYQIRYREGLDLVIRGISLNVRGGEKIGIVGRTGAGKSSLTLGLFRIVEAAGGQIVIDGLDISQMGLHQLRSRLTIIPQDPVLFSGTLRDNVDPFKSYSDDQVWKALELSHLKTFVKGLTAGLDHEIAENGENLSVGQRQLVCLARAILRKTKVLILDEATAAVDLETDDLIQKTIRTEFADCTILTIAHRLNTILDSDRVLVLDKGLVAECDSPQNLLANRDSIFFSMAKNAGIVS
uniref:ABC-type glutathione-S-conjugate transporter n=1 Tax=Anopheles dirus TaxID=7168 RepID=A0A182NES5_9DIPT